MKIKNEIKRNNFITLLYKIDTQYKLDLFIFSLELIKIKPLLIAETDIYCDNIRINIGNINQLSLKFDNITKDFPYYKRVVGSLLSLLFFQKIENNELNFMSKDSIEYLTRLSYKYQQLKQYGIEANQIFMLMFNESINQSIKSNAGSNYEDRVKNVLISLGIQTNKIKKIHDDKDKSTEYDFYFEYNSKIYGIGAKRTLRERYKQFIKTSYTTNIDVMIEITLGIDLTEEKANTIKQHKVYLFVADEVYDNYKYLQQNDYVFPASKLTLETLEQLK